ncbi:helix-turn-helix domain-containing protein [Cryptosporangium phraense]|uniref:Helix-turn-helix transcriptional regulator n=1 Tax=Cryptosporangium phraense TaxID=2593070 RepID=A0A545ATI2_9ACTN|nr:XRE family transcriptional regulator [Cryptosporangium phraense]TQS44646.1 helix-turn-helix transcriptional regulator [Cryptosporangium phraense]
MADLDDVLTAVGPRLKSLRIERGTTLTQLAESTGISVSTLSRLESGQRKPTLELLLPLARAHQVQLDELVGAPATGDPRVHMKPYTAHGRTTIPLSQHLGGLRAYKQIIPPTPASVDVTELRVHEGYEWMYVLSGRVRLILGEHDFVLGVGEVVEFDCRTPHSISNPGPAAAEVLALFGPQGERIHVRARPASG